MNARSLVAPWILLLATACPDRFDVDDSQPSTTGGTDAEGTTTRGAPETTTGSSATAAETFPPPPPTSGASESESGFGGECDEGDIVCASSQQPFRLVCEGGTWRRVPESHTSDAGDCDGFCRAQTGGAAIASACTNDACVCDRACPGSPKEATWEDGYCADSATFWNCVGGEWFSSNCDQVCKSSYSSAAVGVCSAGAFWGKDEYYDTCLCDISGAGSCEDSCGSKAGVPDGEGECYCDVDCETYKDCCHDFYEVCGAKALAPDDGIEIRSAPVAEPEVDGRAALSRWPSLRAYPEIPMALLDGLAAAETVAVLAGLAEAFAGSAWPTERRWNRFGAIDIDTAAFVSLEGSAMTPLHRISLGCLGGFLEAFRLLEAPSLGLEVALAPAPSCPLAHDNATEPCNDDDHTGLHVLLNVRDAYLPAWNVELVEADDLQTLRDRLRPSPEPYYVSASHLGRGNGNRRYHHMMVIVVEPRAAATGPVVFDTTGRRGVSARRVPWSDLSRYLGIVLADSSRFPYARGTNEIAILHSPD